MKKETHSYTLTRESGYNPFFLREDSVLVGEISKINFFKKGEDGVKYSTNWFDVMYRRLDGTMLDIEKYPISSNNGVKSIVLPYTSIPKCNRLNFSRCDAFVMKSKDPAYYGKYELYMNIDSLHDFTVTEIKDKPYTARETKNETRITFSVEGTPVREMNRTLVMNERNEMTVIFYCNHYFNKTKYGEFCESISKTLSSQMLDHTYSEIEVESLISTGKIDELANIIAEFRKEFPAVSQSSD